MTWQAFASTVFFIRSVPQIPTTRDVNRQPKACTVRYQAPKNHNRICKGRSVPSLSPAWNRYSCRLQMTPCTAGSALIAAKQCATDTQMLIEEFDLLHHATATCAGPKAAQCEAAGTHGSRAAHHTTKQIAKGMAPTTAPSSHTTPRLAIYVDCNKISPRSRTPTPLPQAALRHLTATATC